MNKQNSESIEKSPIMQFIDLYNQVDFLKESKVMMEGTLFVISMDMINSLKPNYHCPEEEIFEDVIKLEQEWHDNTESFYINSLPILASKYPLRFKSAKRFFSRISPNLSLDNPFENLLANYKNFEYNKSTIVRNIQKYRQNLDPDLSKFVINEVNDLEQTCLNIK